eukprot:1095685-Amorphochlora_amoeboformis.AAC.1
MSCNRAGARATVKIQQPLSCFGGGVRGVVGGEVIHCGFLSTRSLIMVSLHTVTDYGFLTHGH